MPPLAEEDAADSGGEEGWNKEVEKACDDGDELEHNCIFLFIFTPTVTWAVVVRSRSCDQKLLTIIKVILFYKVPSDDLSQRRGLST